MNSAFLNSARRVRTAPLGRLALTAAAFIAPLLASSSPVYAFEVTPATSLTSLPLGFGFSLATGDFDDDGNTDLVVGDPGCTLSQKDRAGCVFVFDGANYRKDGAFWWAGAPAPFRISEASSFIGRTAQANAAFGFSLAVADFDGDGTDDLAIGAPGQTVSGQAEAGAVHVVFGAHFASSPADAFAKRKGQFLHQDTGSVAGAAEPRDHFGWSLATGDFDGDTYTGGLRWWSNDLAVGVPHEDIQVSNVDRFDAGLVNVLFGVTGTGLSGSGSVALAQNNVGGRIEGGDMFGYSLSGGSVFSPWDTAADLAIGVPSEDIEQSDQTLDDAGVAYLLRSSASRWQSSISVTALGTDVATDFGYFGYSVAIMNPANCTGDLYVGAPGYYRGAGIAFKYHGAETAGDWFDQMSFVSGETREAGDGFGAALATLAARVGVGAPGENLSGSFADQGTATAYLRNSGLSCPSETPDYASHFRLSGSDSAAAGALLGWSLAFASWGGYDDEAVRIIMGAPGQRLVSIRTFR